MRSILEINRTAFLQLERSYTPMAEQLGKHDFTMELFWNEKFPDIKNGSGLIEWDIPTLEQTEHIGIWTVDGELSDYDGVFSLNPSAIELLEKAGIVVGEDYAEMRDPNDPKYKPYQ